MLSALPLLFLALCALASAGALRRRNPHADARDMLAVGAVAAGAWAALGAELLSAFHAFAAGPVLAWWAVPTVALALWLWRRPPAWSIADLSVARGGGNRALLIAGLVIVAVTGAVALLTPPTTWDSLGYHLPRQLFWIENRTVAHYASTDLRQLEMPPLAEFIGAQLMLLSGTDHQANMVQWAAFALGAAVASAIARDLGAGARGQTVAALLTLLNPAAATQAENAKNDLVVALWALILAHGAVRVWQTRSLDRVRALFIGATLGVLLLTKGTAYLIAPPYCAVIAAGALRGDWRRAIFAGAAILLVAGAINLPHWERNWRMFGSPLGLPAERRGFDLANTTHSPAALTSNLVRNVTLHTGTPWDRVNARQFDAVTRLHESIGIDASDPATTAPAKARYDVAAGWRSDGNNGAPVHLLLITAGAIGLVVRRPGGDWPLRLAPFAACFLFVALLKWQPWHARLHIPFLALFAPAMGAWLGTRAFAAVGALVPAMALATLSILYNEAKPLAGRDSIIGVSRDQLLARELGADEPTVRDAVALLAALQPRTVGLALPSFRCEYVIMRQILDSVSPRPRFFNMRPNYGAVGRTDTACPDAALIWDVDVAGPVVHSPSRGVMYEAAAAGAYHVYVPAPRLEELQQRVSVPVFHGWDKERGLKPLEGPYPALDLPPVRWADTPETSFGFASDGSPGAIVISARRNDRMDQVMTVALNDVEVYRFEFGANWRWYDMVVPIQPVAGRNSLTISYSNVNEPGPARAVLFRRLQILPRSLLSGASAAASP